MAEEAASLEALHRVDFGAKEGIKNLDRRLTMVEDRQAEAARLQAQDMREIREKMDVQARRMEMFSEQQAVIMKTSRENETSLEKLTTKVYEISSGLDPLSKTVISIAQNLERINVPELKNNHERLEDSFISCSNTKKNYEEKMENKLDKLRWWIIGGMGTILMSIIGVVIANYFVI